MRAHRKEDLEIAAKSLFDVVIIGGGINGACLYHHLCNQGYRVLLADQGDFAGGTSQASVMMIWGGLLYLKNLDLRCVLKLSASRDRMIGAMKEWIRPQTFRIIPSRARNTAIVTTALYLYWLLSGFRRARPHSEKEFSELTFLDRSQFHKALEYEEGCVMPSDARFVLHWILPHRNEHQIALNHCGVEGGSYDRRSKEWSVQLYDSLIGREVVARTRLIVNAAGVWADSVNQQFEIQSEYKHIFSKGVFLGLKRNPEHTIPLILDTERQGDCMSFIPWGPVSLWGPTETRVNDLDEGFCVTPADVESLLQELNRNLAEPVGPDQIVSFRCGVRPLAVKRSFSKDCYPLELSRKYRIERNKELPWISIFGGKLTDCIVLAESVSHVVRDHLAPTLPCESQSRGISPEDCLHRREFESFPGLAETVPTPAWCYENELCGTLEDYLRRRTNISQWVERGGFGHFNENSAHLRTICRVFSCNHEASAETMLLQYQQKIHHQFDRVLSELREGKTVPGLKEYRYVS